MNSSSDIYPGGGWPMTGMPIGGIGIIGMPGYIMGGGGIITGGGRMYPGYE